MRFDMDEFRGKNTEFVKSWLRSKGLGSLFEVFESKYKFCKVILLKSGRTFTYIFNIYIIKIFMKCINQCAIFTFYV